MSLDTLHTLTPQPAHVAAQPGSFAFTSPVGVWADAGAGDANHAWRGKNGAG